MNILRILAVLVAALQLPGCATSLGMSPQYNSETKVLEVNGLTFDNVIHYKEEKDRIVGSPIMRNIEFFEIEDSTCPTIQVVRQKLVNDAYFISSMKDWLMLEHNDACLTREFHNVNSLRCQDSSMSSPNFYMSSSISTNRGYSGLTVYVFNSNDCLKKFESHYLKISDTKGVGSYNSNKLSAQEKDNLSKLVDDN